MVFERNGRRQNADLLETYAKYVGTPGIFIVRHIFNALVDRIL